MTSLITAHHANLKRQCLIGRVERTHNSSYPKGGVSCAKDSRGGLWVGTEKSGVSLIKDGRVTNVDFAPGPGGHLASACEDVTGAVWLYSKDGRLARFRNGQPDKTWPVDFGRSDFRGVIAEKSGDVWIGSDGGLSRVASDVTMRGCEKPTMAGPARPRSTSRMKAA